MAGSTLVPPVGNKKRLEQLGPLVPAIVRVEGRDWKGSTTDVAIAGAPTLLQDCGTACLHACRGWSRYTRILCYSASHQDLMHRFFHENHVAYNAV